MTDGTPGKKPPAPSVRRYPINLCCAACGKPCDWFGKGKHACEGKVLYIPDYGKCQRHRCEVHDDV